MGTLHTGGHRPCLAAGGFTETVCGTAGAKNIDVVFRENERGRIYGVTFIDHDRREVFNGSRMGKEFSANVFNDYFKWLENIPEKERGGHSATELRQHHRHESGSTLELAAGILSMETNPRDYEEEAFARRMKKRRRPDANVAFRQNKYQPIYIQFLCSRKTI